MYTHTPQITELLDEEGNVINEPNPAERKTPVGDNRVIRPSGARRGAAKALLHAIWKGDFSNATPTIPSGVRPTPGQQHHSVDKLGFQTSVS